MSVSSLPERVRFGSNEDPFWIEFDRRIGNYSMRNNHYHTEFEMYYLFTGERNYFIKDSVYQIQAGDLVLIDSNALHKTSQRGEPNHERIVLYYTLSFLTGLSQSEQELLLAPFTRNSPLRKLNLQEKLQVESLLLAMLNELMEQPLGYAVRVRNIAIDLLLLSARLTQKKGPSPAEEPFPVQRKITDIVRYINLHYGSSLQLDEIAKQFYISKSHLSRIFKKVTGFGFAEYVNITRVKEAERLLRETGLNITQVAEQCGFESLTHFGKVFKALSGLSPRDYRKLSQPKQPPQPPG